MSDLSRFGIRDGTAFGRTESEDSFTVAVVNLAHRYAWLAVHHRQSARKVGGRWISNIIGDRGSPDLILVKPPRVIFAELKTGTKYGKGRAEGHAGGKSSYGLRPEQRVWRAALEACPGIEYRMWKPEDMEAIAAELVR